MFIRSVNVIVIARWKVYDIDICLALYGLSLFGKSKAFAIVAAMDTYKFKLIKYKAAGLHRCNALWGLMPTCDIVKPQAMRVRLVCWQRRLVQLLHIILYEVGDWGIGYNHRQNTESFESIGINWL